MLSRFLKLGLAWQLTVLLLALKLLLELLGLASWGWLWVFTPVLVTLTFLVATGILLVAFAIIEAIFKAP